MRYGQVFYTFPAHDRSGSFIKKGATSMYRCDSCGKCVPPKTPCKRVVVKKMRFLHPERPRAKKGVAILKNGKKKMVWIPDPGGWGDQIAQESRMCPRCASTWEKEQREMMKQPMSA